MLQKCSIMLQKCSIMTAYATMLSKSIMLKIMPAESPRPKSVTVYIDKRVHL